MRKPIASITGSRHICSRSTAWLPLLSSEVYMLDFFLAFGAPKRTLSASFGVWLTAQKLGRRQSPRKEPVHRAFGLINETESPIGRTAPPRHLHSWPLDVRARPHRGGRGKHFCSPRWRPRPDHSYLPQQRHDVSR